jgi:hypothetical protein
MKCDFSHLRKELKYNKIKYKNKEKRRELIKVLTIAISFYFSLETKYIYCKKEKVDRI